ncbi:MAG: cobalt-precorrin-5B (C(1))-methyltransferase CbiD [Holophaga sp.]|nr:cobalt-precorrin-5B (C(1))-methyltransferase CbiD [Holophaga sp.]
MGGGLGFSTGACAAAAAKAAALAASGAPVGAALEIPFPGGARLALPIAWARPVPGGGEAAVVKDAGGDPDISHGATVIVAVTRAPGWSFAAGTGVGVVTLAGLRIPPGEPAINPAPRAMIRAALEEVGWTGAAIRVSIPGGAELARRTFNPRLGVLGGLSILGSTGRVRPFSLDAVRGTIDCSLDVVRAAGHDAVAMVPGHLGERALAAWKADLPVVEVANEWGHALDLAAAKSFRALLLAGHPGKLVKLAEGHFDTHSARSPSPLPRVHALAETVAGCVLATTPTVEGVFQALAPELRPRLAEPLARAVLEAAGSRTGLPCGVLLTTMDGGIYGGCLEGTPWA